jgi:hypothetical protein
MPFAVQVRGLRGEDMYLGTVRNAAIQEPYSTVVVADGFAHELMFFNYQQGGVISGTQNTAAGLTETNMRVPNQWVVDGECEVCALEVGVLAVTPWKFHGHPLKRDLREDYEPTFADVRELLARTIVRFHTGGHMPFVGLPLADWPMRLQPGTGMLVSGRVRFGHGIPLGRIEKFWGELAALDPVRFHSPEAVLLVRMRLCQQYDPPTPEVVMHDLPDEDRRLLAAVRALKAAVGPDRALELVAKAAKSAVK